MHEALHTAAGVMGNPGLFKDRVGALIGAQPHGEHRLGAPGGAAMLPHHFADRQRDVAAVRNRRRAMNHHRCIDVWIFEDRAQRCCKARRIGVAYYVGGVGARPCRRHYGVQLRDCFWCKVGELAAERAQFVHRQNAKSAAIGENGEPVAGEGRNAAQRFCGGEQFVDCVDAQHARAPERGAVDVVGARQRAGVRGRRLRRAPRATRLDNDDRFYARGCARG